MYVRQQRRDGLTIATGTASSSGDNTLLSAPGSGVRLVIVAMTVQNESDTATTVILKDGSTNKWRALLQNQGDALGLNFDAEKYWKLGDNAALVLNLSGANSHGYNIYYYKEMAVSNNA